MKDIKKELIIALKYVCPKLGYGFFGLGIALLLTQPGKMGDILFSVGGVGLLGFTLGGVLFYVIGDIFGPHNYHKEENKKLTAHNKKLRNIIANGGNNQPNHPKAKAPAKVAVPTESPSTQPKKPFDFEAEYEDASMGYEPTEEVADEQIPEPAEEEKTDLQESSES